MMDWLSDIAHNCEDYVKNNPITSAIIIGVLTNLVTDLVKQTWAKALTGSKILSRYVSRKILERGIRGYELQLAEIENFRNNKVDILTKYVYFLLDSFTMGLFFVVTRYVILNYVSNPNAIWGFYGASARVVSGIVFGSFVYQSTLYNLVYNIDKYERNTQKILERLKAQLP